MTDLALLELRQYTLHPGKRDTLIDLFDRELIEGQEAVGMRVIGQFRDLDNPDRFVWLRGFPDIGKRADALQAFYDGPIWQAHRDAANATMIDSDDVLLLQPVQGAPGFDLLEQRPPIGAEPAPTIVTMTICFFSGPVPDGFGHFATASVANTFPRLPVRTGVNALVWFSQSEGALPVEPDSVQRLRLAPTARSLLR